MIYVGGWLPRGMQPPDEPERWYIGENKPGGRGYWIDASEPGNNPELKELGWKDAVFVAACLAIAVLPALLRRWLR